MGFQEMQILKQMPEVFCVLKVHPFNEDDVSYFKMIVNNYESTTNLICW